MVISLLGLGSLAIKSTIASTAISTVLRDVKEQDVNILKAIEIKQNRVVHNTNGIMDTIQKEELNKTLANGDNTTVDNSEIGDFVEHIYNRGNINLRG